MVSQLLKDCFKLKRCPLCKGMMSHTIERCECIACGFFLSDDCCHGEEKAIKDEINKK